MFGLTSTVHTLVTTEGARRVRVLTDVAVFGNHAAVDKTRQRLLLDGELRHLDRGCTAGRSSTASPSGPPARAIALRDQLRLLVDSMTAANDLGMGTAIQNDEKDF